MAKVSRKAKLQTITARLKQAIADSGLSVYLLSKDMGVAQPILQRFVAGTRDLKLSTADKLAAHFGLKISSSDRK